MWVVELLECNGYGLQSLLAGHLKKDSVHWRGAQYENVHGRVHWKGVQSVGGCTLVLQVFLFIIKLTNH